MTFLQQMSFEQAFVDMQTDAAEINHAAGFSDDALIDDLQKYLEVNAQGKDYARFSRLFDSFRNARVGLKLALIMSELGETLEAVRKNLGPDSHIPNFSSEEAEVADAVIRLMNYATDRKLRLAEAIVAKNEFNRTRFDHTAAGRAEAHGKKF